MSTYAVIGASRGIGLEFVRQLAARHDVTVFATVRSLQSATHLLAAARNLGNVHIIEADITDFAALERAAKQVSDLTGGTLDCLIHNAARVTAETFQYSYDDFPSMDALDEDFIETFKINTLGVIHSIKAFLPLLKASTAPLKKVAVINSAAADPKWSLAADTATTAAYAITKAASIVAATKWAVMVKKDNIVVVSFHPGLVDTWETRGESGNSAQSARIVERMRDWNSKGIKIEVLTPAQSAAAQLKAIDGLTLEKTGSFLKETGEEWAMQSMI